MNLILLASLGACTKQPTVPEERYVEISPQAVETIEALRSHEEALSRGIPQAELDVVEAERRQRLAEDRVTLLGEAMASADDLKRAAVERGDAAAAEAADLRRSEVVAALADAENAQREASRQRELAEAELELLRADVELVHAHLELERARGLDPSGEDIRIARFERAVRQATERRSEAAQRVERARGAVPAT
jgi:hypothetical protein